MEMQLQMDIPELYTDKYKYLSELDNYPAPYSYTREGHEDAHYLDWLEERKIYGFDATETWDLQYSFYGWLYGRLRMYIDRANSVIDLSYHTFKWKGFNYTLLEMIDGILKRIELYFSDEYESNPRHEDIIYTNEIGEIWAMILPYVWW